MGSVYIEQRPATGNDVISWDIAHHLFTRQLQGAVVIITANPAGLLAALRKQWLRVTRKVQRERSSTLDAALILELAKTIAHMQNLAFTSKSPYENPSADVYIVRNEQLQEIPFSCHTLYMVEPVEVERLDAIKEALPYGRLIVTYC